MPLSIGPRTSINYQKMKISTFLSVFALVATAYSNPERYLPIFKFDPSQSEFCYPDYPSSQNDNRCVKNLNQNAPVFCEVDTCNGQTVYTYWLWYGWQRPCIRHFDKGHGNDWERISVYVNPKTKKLAQVVFYQHSGYYTRGYGKFESEGDRPVVYIGKVAHGSYHSHCNGRCSFKQFFSKGCFGDVEFCIGGCGYWDDFRNPGLELRSGNLQPLRPGQSIDGIWRPNSRVCDIPSCEGAGYRSLKTSGCWQNDP